MIRRARFQPLLGAAILALAACGGGSEANTTNAAANAATGNDVVATANQAAAPAPAAPATAGAVTAGYMVGKWSAIGEDCSATIEFRKVGTVATPIGEGKWTLTDDKLAIDYGDGSTPTTSTIKPLGPDRIEITHASGTKETEKRC